MYLKEIGVVRFSAMKKEQELAILVEQGDLKPSNVWLRPTYVWLFPLLSAMLAVVCGSLFDSRREHGADESR